MKILLTGADGFTGLFFQEAAQAAGHELWPLKADLLDKPAVFAEVQHAQADAVVHLAAISFVGHAEEVDFYRVNVVGTLNLLDALSALAMRPSKVLLASSANVYGNCDASPITEEQPAAPVSHYAVSKLAMEHLAKTYLDRLPLVFLRPFNYTGVGQASNFLIPKLVNHFAQRASKIELGNLHVQREFNDVRMVCCAYMALLENGLVGETYNICSGQPFALMDVIHELTEITGHTIDIQVNPAFVRAHEVQRLCGNPAKLWACSGTLPVYALRDTLRWMLDAAADQGVCA
jgi:nucleoside-diphosphate-sugar epimerase